MRRARPRRAHRRAGGSGHDRERAATPAGANSPDRGGSHARGTRARGRGFRAGCLRRRAARFRRARVNGEQPAEVGRRAEAGRCSVRERDGREHLHDVRLRPGAQVRRRVDRAVVAEVQEAVRVNLEMEMRQVVNASPVLPTKPITSPRWTGRVSGQPGVAGQMRVVEVVADVSRAQSRQPPRRSSRHGRSCRRRRRRRRAERGEDIVTVVPAAGHVRSLGTIGVAPVAARRPGRCTSRPAEASLKAARRSPPCAASASFFGAGFFFGVYFTGGFRTSSSWGWWSSRAPWSSPAPWSWPATSWSRAEEARRRRLRGRVIRRRVADQDQRPRRQAAVRTRAGGPERSRPVAKRVQSRQLDSGPDRQRRPVGDCRGRAGDRIPGPRDAERGDRGPEMPTGPVATRRDEIGAERRPIRHRARSTRRHRCVPPGAVPRSTTCTARLGGGQVDRVLRVVKRRGGIPGCRRRGHRRPERGRGARVRRDDREEARSNTRRWRDLRGDPWSYDSAATKAQSAVSRTRLTLS